MPRHTTAKTVAHVVRWLDANEHYSGSAEPGVGMTLTGHGVSLFIPADICGDQWFRPSDFRTTKRMFEPTEAGRAALAQEYPRG